MKTKKSDDNQSVKRLGFLLFLIIVLVPHAIFSFPDNSETRLKMRELITAPTGDAVRVSKMVNFQYTDGMKVKFQVEEQNDNFYLLFINEEDGAFPMYSQGTYIIKRSSEDGSFVQTKIFLKDTADSYLRIYPGDDRAVMEITLYGKLLYSGINLPFSFADVLTAPFDKIKAASGGQVDWDLIFPDVFKGLYNVKKDFIEKIREQLPIINDVDDGAMDADGSYKYIETLEPQDDGGFNCSGFVKWAADGIYWEAADRYMEIEPLKSKNFDMRGNRWSISYEDSRDPYFGLDWTRNIAVEIQSAQQDRAVEHEAADVRNIPWSRYVDNVGLPIEDLKLILYYLAVNEPETVYLGSVNVSWGTEPVLRQHIHTAVLAPVIDSDSSFRDIVFDRNIETNADDLANRYPGAYIHLVRLKVRDGFRLPELESKPKIGTGNYFRR